MAMYGENVPSRSACETPLIVYEPNSKVVRMRNVECRTNSNASDVRLPDG